MGVHGVDADLLAASSASSVKSFTIELWRKVYLEMILDYAVERQEAGRVEMSRSLLIR